METSRILFFFFFSILIHFVKPTIAQRDPDPLVTSHDCYTNTTGNVTSNTTYSGNLNQLLSSLSYITPMVNGFYNFSYGENPDKVNAIALCSADRTPAECGSCVNSAAQELLNLCSNHLEGIIQKEGIIWYPSCTVRYSDRYIFGRNESQPMGGQEVSPNPILYKDALTPFFDELRKNASGHFGKFAYANYKAGNSLNGQDFTVYALMQCTPDLAEGGCDDCLHQAQVFITNCCNQYPRARVFAPSCNLRYDNSSFFAPPGTRFPTHIF